VTVQLCGTDAKKHFVKLELVPDVLLIFSKNSQKRHLHMKRGNSCAMKSQTFIFITVLLKQERGERLFVLKSDLPEVRFHVGSVVSVPDILIFAVFTRALHWSIS
jgi:hypothetical protein